MNELPEGDSICMRCESAVPDKQFRVWKKWFTKHEDVRWEISEEHKSFFFYKSRVQNKEREVNLMDFFKYVEVALAIHAAASAITALTPTPKDDAVVSKLYKVIETLALVVGKAKQR